MARDDAASKTTRTGQNRPVSIEQSGILSYGNPFVGHTGGKDYQIVLERTGGPAATKYTWKDGSGNVIHTKVYQPGEHDKLESWVVRATRTLTTELVNPSDDPLTVKFVVH
jgi:hypothetical protein